MKKSNTPHQGSFSTLLIKYYLFLTLALFLCIALVQLTLSYELNRFMPPAQLEELFQLFADQPTEQFDEKTLDQYLGKGSSAQIYDEKKILLFSSQSMAPLTPGELECIPDYEREQIFQLIPLFSAEGDKRYLLTRESPGDATNNGYLILDQNYRIIEKNYQTDRSSFTQKEFDLLFGSTGSKSNLIKRHFIRPDGSERTLVFSLPLYEDKDYAAAISLWRYSWIVLAGLYLLMVAVSIYWLNRRTNHLLQPLDNAIAHLLSDQKMPPISYAGPREFVEIYSRFNELALRLEESEEARNQMLADISHDLKTPVTVIQGYAKALHDSLVPPEKQAQYLNTLYQKSLHLTELIDRFFEFSTLNHPRLLLSTEKKDLSAFVTEYLAEKYQEIDLAGFSLEVEIPEKPLYCQLDALQLRRVFDNLIANTLNYNPKGTCLFFSLEEMENHLRLRLGDDGVGIPVALEKTLFEPFAVGDESRGNGGTGLGLAISSRIIQLHGGSLSLVPPEAPCHTLFQIELPRS